MAQAFAQSFYKGKLWRQQRQHALHRDAYQCADCGGRAEEVHHIVELTAANITDYSVSLDLDNLVCLCFDCHQKRHRGAGDVDEEFAFDEAGQVVRR
ncbi:MAG: HNH endonuclease [Christensenellales bacterium]